VNAILGLDTSTSELTVAVVGGGQVLAERESGPDPGGRPRHATELLPAVEAALRDAGGWDAVGRIAVGVGPGTFTGLRIGVASARALAQARGIPLTGVSSLAALAAGAHEAHGPAGFCLAVLDAKRGEAFAALYDGAGAELSPAWVGPPEELAKRVAELGSAPLAVGDGSVRFRDQLEAAGAVVPADDDPAHRLRARHLCRLASAAPDGERDVEPNYLRRPDAELWRERDHRS
jgi:tRNA threonylcarbamoyladenosine biosynthesis protein TsaB